MRILILAEDCNPDWPSLPIVAYKYARSLAEHIEIVVATQIRNKPNIDRDGLGNAKVVYFDTEHIASPLYKFAKFLRGGTEKGWTLQVAMNYPSYLMFEYLVWQHFKQKLESGYFDVVHRISPMSPTLPSPLAKWSPVPFLVGPLNGNLPWPQQFNTELKREREWMSYLRQAHKLLPYYESTYHNSAGILAAFDHTIADLPTSAKSKAINFPEVGIDPELFNWQPRQKRSQKTILFVGRLVPYKLPEVVVRAVANSPILQQHQLVIVGEGPERPRLEHLIQKHDLADCIKLTGKIPQSEVGQLMRQAEILASPSIRELGAGVVIEAMACGMACVVVDYGGPATLIAADRGIKVPLGNLDRLVEDYTRELESLVQDDPRIQRLGKSAHDHAIQHYSWNAKAQKTLAIYNYITDNQQTKPSFWDDYAPVMVE
ncbi:MAG: glycosyltransferase family 4 protein [Microcoleaceae cyanobacterium]